MDKEAFKELYIERMCPFCSTKDCKKLIKITKKNVISIKCEEYNFKKRASK